MASDFQDVVARGDDEGAVVFVQEDGKFGECLLLRVGDGDVCEDLACGYGSTSQVD